MAKAKTNSVPVKANVQNPNEELALVGGMLADNYDGPKAMGSVDLTTRAGKRMLINAANNGTFKPADLHNKVFRIVNWLAQLRTYHDEDTGADRDGIEIVFYDPAGKTLKFGSEAVVRFLDSARGQYGNGPYDPPIMVMVSPYETSNKRRSYSVMEVDPEYVDTEQQTW